MCIRPRRYALSWSGLAGQISRRIVRMIFAPELAIEFEGAGQQGNATLANTLAN